MPGKRSAKEVLTALANLEKGLGNRGAPKLVLSSDVYEQCEVIPFGIEAIDKATGVGGAPRGRITELFGLESGGKSYAALKLIASAQRMGLNACLVDVEYSLDPKWASSHGVDLPKLYVGRGFDYGEQVMDYVVGLTKSGVMDLIVVDSTAAIIPKAELEASLEDAKVAELARVMSRAVKQINDYCGKTNTLVLFVNQVREKVGVMFGNPETTPGGRALKFYASMRIRVARQDKLAGLRKDDPIRGIVSKVEIVKNKVAPPFAKGTFEIIFSEKSLRPLTKLAELGARSGVIKRRKREDDTMAYYWGAGKTAVEVGVDCTAVGEFLKSEGKVGEFLKEVQAKEGDRVDPDFVKTIMDAAATVLSQAPAPEEEEDKDACPTSPVAAGDDAGEGEPKEGG